MAAGATPCAGGQLPDQQRAEWQQERTRGVVDDGWWCGLFRMGPPATWDEKAAKNPGNKIHVKFLIDVFSIQDVCPFYVSDNLGLTLHFFNKASNALSSEK